jgi:WD40 repeat protein
MQTFTGESKATVLQVSLSGDGRYVLTIQQPYRASLWDRTTQEIVYSAEDFEVWGGMIHPSSRVLFLWGAGGVLVVDLTTFEERQLEGNPHTSALVSTTVGSEVITTTLEAKGRDAFAGYNLDTTDHLKRRWLVLAGKNHFSNSPLAVSTGGEFFAAQHLPPPLEKAGKWIDQPSIVHVRSASSGKLLHQCELPPNHLLQAVTEEGRVYVTHLSQVMIWDVKTGESVKAASVKGSGQVGVVLAPSGQELIAFKPKSAFQMKADSLTMSQEWTFNLVGELRCVAYAPDGLTAVVGTSKGQFAVWDIN